MRSVLLATLCLAAASHASSFDEAAQRETDPAAALKGRQVRASRAALSIWVEGEGTTRREDARWGMASQKRGHLAEAYARAELAKNAGKDPKAARLLLLELRKPASRAEVAPSSDPRVGELLRTLRARAS